MKRLVEKLSIITKLLWTIIIIIFTFGMSWLIIENVKITKAYSNRTEKEKVDLYKEWKEKEGGVK